MPRSRKPALKLRVKRKLKGEGFFDTISSWGRSVVNAYTPKLITGIPAPSYTADPTPPPIEGGLPDKSILKDIADNSYKGTSDEMKDIPGFTLKLKTPTLVIYQKDTENMMVIGVRGTADFRDFKAWFSTAFNVIPDSQRFKEDIQTISDFQQKYPVNTYTYYATGHSLGGTLIDELIKKGMVKEARTYNPAIETSDIPDVSLSQKNHRIYADGDPLYLLQGRFDNPTEVRKSYKYYPSSMYDFVPGYDKYKQHILANPVFVGGMSNPFYHLQGAARPYTAEEWECKLCKGENSLLAQKKRKIAEREKKVGRYESITYGKDDKDYDVEIWDGQGGLDGYMDRRIKRSGKVVGRLSDFKWADFAKDIIELENEEDPPYLPPELIDEDISSKRKTEKERKAEIARLEKRLSEYNELLDDEDRRMTRPKRENEERNRMLVKKELQKLKSMSGKGMMANSQFYRTDPKRNPLLRGGNDDEMARRMAEFLAPHISSGVGKVADSIQDFFKTPEQREQEKRDKAALEEAERRKKETDEDKWSSYLSPFLRGEGFFDDVKKGIESVYGKAPISAHHVWTPAEQADINRRQRITDVDKQRAKMVSSRLDYVWKNIMENAQNKDALQSQFRSIGTDNVKDYSRKVRELATKAAEEYYPY